ncbi:MAG: hypothetical protein ACR2QW_19610 [bacterium]
MVFLMGEIVFGLIVMAVVGFTLGWVLRGIRERNNRRRVEAQETFD